MLNLRPYKEQIEEIEPGQTLRLNHTDCEAGEDTRRRLYLTRTHADETKVVGYCHNCQQGGYWNDDAFVSYRDTKHSATTASPVRFTDEVTEPVGLIEDCKLWPMDVKAWQFSRCLTHNDVHWWGIKYDPSTDRIYIPRWDVLDRKEKDTGNLIGYQLRKVHEYQQPKYITAQKEDAQGWTFIYPKQASCDYVVIVEDLISAAHILNATEQEGNGANLPGVYINYGTKVDPVLMYKMALNNEYAVVWLDNDNAHVVNQAKMMERTIKMYNNRIRVGRVNLHSDPKHYDHNSICSILDEVWNNG